MQLIENDTADWKAKSEVIAVFHTNAGHVTLKDSSYNSDRNIATGNPHKDLLTDLMKRGCKSNCVAQLQRLTGGATRISFPTSRSTRMPWRGRHNSFKKGL